MESSTFVLGLSYKSTRGTESEFIGNRKTLLCKIVPTNDVANSAFRSNVLCSCF